MRDDVLDRPKEACGVFGIALAVDGEDIVSAVRLGLHTLQHRGQESAGIAVSDGHSADIHVGMGLVDQVFEADLSRLKGHLAIGHNRYSTTGASHIRNAQPYLVETYAGPLAVAHNGNLTNADALRDELLAKGAALTSSSDSELVTRLLARPAAADANWKDRLLRLLDVAEGAYSLVALTCDAVWGLRDPHGLRPLCLGRIERDGNIVGHVLASESTALRPIGATFVREVGPGELVRIDRDGVTSWQGPAADPALCVFEYVYFARPDTKLEGRSVSVVRERFGEQLAKEAPADADIVIDVPDSGKPSAMGFSRVSGLDYREGLIKNRYVGRTFIEPTSQLRKHRVHLKYSPVPEVLAGQRVVLVDDSIVRGTTIGPLIRLLRDAGAAEVHVRVAAPPIKHPCFMGVDMSDYDQLIAHRLPVEEITRLVGADSLAYLSVEGMMACVQRDLAGKCGHCDACFTGKYPVRIPGHTVEKERFARSGAAQ